MFQPLRLSGVFVVAVVLAGCGGTGAKPPANPPTDDFPPELACTYFDETLPSLEIAAGEACELTTTTVTGDVTLAPGASLNALAGATLGGVRGQGAAEVILDEAFVEGDVELSGGDTVDIFGGNIGGDVQLSGYSGVVNVTDVVIEGNVQVSQNTGGVSIEEAFITGNLLCEGNDPAPEGFDNTVSGSKEGQCSAF